MTQTSRSFGSNQCLDASRTFSQQSLDSQYGCKGENHQINYTIFNSVKRNDSVHTKYQARIIKGLLQGHFKAFRFLTKTTLFITFNTLELSGGMFSINLTRNG